MQNYSRVCCIVHEVRLFCTGQMRIDGQSAFNCPASHFVTFIMGELIQPLISSIANELDKENQKSCILHFIHCRSAIVKTETRFIDQITCHQIVTKNVTKSRRRVLYYCIICVLYNKKHWINILFISVMISCSIDQSFNTDWW